MKKNATFNPLSFIGLSVFTALIFCPAAPAAEIDYTPVLGKWEVVTKMGVRDMESIMEFHLGEDGQLRGLGSGRGGGGSTDLNEVAFDGETLSWKLTVQGNIIPVSVKLDGDTFEGAASSPLGALPILGKRFDEKAASAAQDRLSTLVGDWDISTTFNGRGVDTKMRIRKDDDGDVSGTIIMLGSRTTIHEYRLEDDQLLFNVGIPFIATHPAEVRATLNESGTYFEGVVKSAAGDIPIRGGLVDTARLVVAPYDDPTLLLGAWRVTTSVDDTDMYESVITFKDTPQRLYATIEADGEVFEANSVNYHLVNERLGMASTRVHVDIPALSPDELVFEMIINGNSFDGEELYSDGRILISGEKLE